MIYAAVGGDISCVFVEMKREGEVKKAVVNRERQIPGGRPTGRVYFTQTNTSKHTRRGRHTTPAMVGLRHGRVPIVGARAEEDAF
ncbi:unnamed protein product [Heligmosomoides polygyrus]|uniref:Transposase n=1 Tax=Heligmosomoides polygyrus TaxID=6339 RepID=A0A183GLD4_HELPZ|nr:unnamed protein product [Heligmosomoides polygyrus]